MATAASVAQGRRRAPSQPRSPWQLSAARVRRDRVAVVALGFLAFLLLTVSAGAPLAAHLLGHGPNDPFPYAVNINAKPVGPWTRVPDLNDVQQAGDVDAGLPKPPAGTHTTLLILGGDGQLGRDEFLRVLYGGRVTLEVALGATLLAIVLGIAFGAAAGYFGGWLDAVVSRLVDLVMTFPLLLFLLMLGTAASPRLRDVTFGGLLNQGVLMLILLIGAFTWFYPARIVRAEVLSLRRREFVEAAVSVGASDARILRKHLVPALAPTLIAYSAVLMATNVMLEAGVSFLGVGIDLPTASWGTLLTAAWGSLLSPFRYDPMTFTPWTTVVPSVAIFLTVLAFNLVADAIRDAIDPQGAR
jgi:peptide/nickel transport system permease protein